MIEILKYIPLLLTISSFRYYKIYPVACLFMAAYLGYSSHILSKEFGLFFIKEEALFLIVSVLFFIFSFRKNTKFFFRSKVHTLILFIIFIEQSLFSSLLLVELFRMSMFSKISSRHLENQLVSLFIRSYFFICIFLNINTQNYMMIKLSLNDFNIKQSFVFLAICYLVDFVLEFYKDLDIIKNKWTKVVSLIVFILVLINYVNGFGLFGNFLFTYISEFTIELSVFLVLMFYLFRKINIFWPALLLVTYFSSVVLVINSFYLYLLLSPVFVLFISSFFKNSLIEKIISNEQALLPITFTFFISIAGISYGNGMIKIIVSVIVLCLIVKNYLNKVEIND